MRIFANAARIVSAQKCACAQRQISAIMRTMHIADEITRVEAEAAQSGISIEALCREAGIHRATWQRWKAGVVGPTMKNWSRVKDALAQAQKGRAA
jgi:predicted transcriptional regulator